MSQHRCKCQDECDCKPIPNTGMQLSVADVYQMDGIISTISADNQQVSVGINCEDLKTAYNDSSASADGTSFETFEAEVQAAADEAATAAYPTVAGANSNLAELSDFNTRIVTIRICIRWRWLKIYIIIKI